jgi:hypothetical protein
MIPENVERFSTDGEKQSYRFLEAVAKPDEDYLCWYLPDIKGKEPRMANGGRAVLSIRMGVGPCKYMIIYKKGLKNSRFLVLNI